MKLVAGARDWHVECQTCGHREASATKAGALILAAHHQRRTVAHKPTVTQRAAP